MAREAAGNRTISLDMVESMHNYTLAGQTVIRS